MAAIAITGAGGRMGKTIAQAAIESRLAAIGGALEKTGHPSVGKDMGVISGLEKIGVRVTDKPGLAFKKAEVIIDFSTPDATVANLKVLAALKKPIVIGTTGFSSAQRVIIKKTSAVIPIVFAPNMSIGVNVMFKIAADCVKTFDGYDMEIVESHHRHKVDAPSGTAIKIAEIMAETLKRDIEDVAVYSRRGITGEREPGTIGIHSVRAGDIVGDHTIIFAGEGERLEITHRAHSRHTFATGAIKAALWIKDKPPGLYDMQDVLGLNGVPAAIPPL